MLERSSKGFLRGLGAALIAAGALVAPAHAEFTPCAPPYDEATGWMTPFHDDTPGVEGCPSFADQAAIYSVIGLSFDPARALVLQGSFASTRFESYAFDFFDAADRRIAESAVTLHDLEPVSGASILPSPGSCNPATQSAGSPSACSPRDFVILVVRADAAEWFAAEYPGVNVVAAPADAAKARVIRRTYLDGLDGQQPLPAPLWCDALTLGCEPLGQHPEVRLPLDDPAFWGGAEGGPGPDDPCAGASPGRCSEVVEMYAFQAPELTNPNPATDYAAANLQKLGWNDIVVMTHERAPRSAVQYPEAPLTGDEELRFWSFCVAVRAATRIFDCVNDYEIPIGPGQPGHRIVIGPAGRKVWDRSVRRFRPLEEAVAARGDHFLRWGDRTNGFVRMLVYRNSYPSEDFEGKLRDAVQCDGNLPELCVPLSAPPPVGIGVHAPRGKHCRIPDYLRDTGACDLP